MQFDNHIVLAYLKNKPISKEALYPYIKGYQKPDIKRKEIVEELQQQLMEIIDGYPIFNPAICNAIFSNQAEFIDSICVCPFVGSDTLFYCEIIKNQLHIFIDLLCVANHTRIVSQMVYIMNNILSLEISKACILQQYPLNNKEYSYLLDTATFVYGLAHWIAWNTSCNQYVFNTSKYEGHREKAFGLLSQALHVDNKAMQHKILLHIHGGDLWEQFPVVAGMFYFDDIFHEFGLKGLKQLYELGPKRFACRIFE